MPASQACKFQVQSSSSLGFDAKSSLHPVHGTATQLSGTIEATIESGVLVLEPPPSMHVEFPVERLSSGNPLQDREMWKLLDSKRNPTIRADLKGLTQRSGNTYRAAGVITMSGRAKTYEGDLVVAAGNDKLTIDGALVIDIRDFGLQPPRLLMITVQPHVSVKLHLIATLAPGAA
jgi:polyisoprenoid-binding protein YceI